jgi:hypothetical protein
VHAVDAPMAHPWRGGGFHGSPARIQRQNARARRRRATASAAYRPCLVLPCRRSGIGVGVRRSARKAAHPVGVLRSGVTANASADPFVAVRRHAGVAPDARAGDAPGAFAPPGRCSCRCASRPAVPFSPSGHSASPIAATWAAPRRGIARRPTPSGGGRGRRLRQGRPLERVRLRASGGFQRYAICGRTGPELRLQFGARALGMSHRSPGRTTAQPCHPVGAELLGKQMATHHPAVRLLFVPGLSHDTLRPAPPQGPGAPSWRLSHGEEQPDPAGRPRTDAAIGRPQESQCLRSAR